MKNISYLLVAMVSALVPFSILNDNKICPHEEISSWIDSGNYVDSKGIASINDAEIIRALEAISSYNKYKTDTTVIDYFKSRIICRDSANYFHKIYKDRKNAFLAINSQVIANYRLDLDMTEGILFELDLLLGAIQTAFPDVDLYDVSKWENKGFFVYPSNYGATGHLSGSNSVDQFKTSVIIQLAEDKTEGTPNEWQVIEDMIYNFGDLKPPKYISNEQISGIEHTGFNCDQPD